MAITKTIQATVKNRTDTAANWTQKNPVLAEGEIIVVQTSAGETRLKIGDGVKTFTQLPYTDEQIYNNVVTSVNGETGDITLANDSKSLGLTSATVGQIPKVKAVDSNGVPTEWEATAMPSGGAGNIKKLTFTGAATGEYDGTTDVNVDIPSDVYVINFDNHGILVNDFDELVNAIKSHKIIVIQEGHAVFTMHEAGFNFDNSNNIENVVLCFINEIIFGIGIIDRNTKKITVHYFDLPVFDRSTLSASGAVYYDKHTQKFVIKDTTPPTATASTAGTIKVGNGLSISADGTLSVTTATYYTGTADPVNTLGADGDLYLKTEG